MSELSGMRGKSAVQTRAASEREADWAKHVARLLVEQGYAKVVEL